MGQSRTLLFTKDDFPISRIPQDYIYFKEKGYFIFPLDIWEHEAEIIVNVLKKFSTMKEVIENKQAFSKTINLIIDLIVSCKIESFLFEHTTDVGTAAADFYFLMVKQSKIYQESDWDSIEDILEYFTDMNDRPDFNKYKHYKSLVQRFRSPGPRPR